MGSTTTTTATTPSPEFQREVVHRTAWKASVMGTLNVLVAVLAVRLILLLAVVGAAFLAWLSLEPYDINRLAVLGTYVLGVVVPLVWLSSRRE